MITLASKEAALRAAKIPIPENFTGAKKSFTIRPEGDFNSIGILWQDAQIYVNKSNGAKGVAVNKKGGSTLSVRKQGGWEQAWGMALACAAERVPATEPSLMLTLSAQIPQPNNLKSSHDIIYLRTLVPKQVDSELPNHPQKTHA